MASISTLKQDHEFLKAYMSRAREIEYDRYRLYALQEHLNTAHNNIQSRIRSDESQMRSLRDDMSRMRQNIQNLDRKPANLGSRTVVVAIVYFIALYFLCQIEWIDNILDLLTFGSSLMFFLEHVILIPLLIAYAIGSNEANQKADEQERKIRSQIRDKEQNRMKIEKEIIRLGGLLDYSDSCLAKCAEQIKRHDAKSSAFYSYGFLHEKYQNLIAATEIFNYLDAEVCYTIAGPQGAAYHFDQIYALNQINNNITGLRGQISSIQSRMRAYGGAPAAIYTISDRISKADRVIDDMLKPMLDSGYNSNTSLSPVSVKKEIGNSTADYFARIQSRADDYISWTRRRVD